MNPGDLILRNQNQTGVTHTIKSAFSTLAANVTMLSLLALLLLSTVIAATDICRAVSGNHGLFKSVVIFAQHHSSYKSDPASEKERYRQERSDLDAFRNERQRWHKLKAEVQDRQSSRQFKKPAKS